jgi:hypothetical protein
MLHHRLGLSGTTHCWERGCVSSVGSRSVSDGPLPSLWADTSSSWCRKRADILAQSAGTVIQSWIPPTNKSVTVCMLANQNKRERLTAYPCILAVWNSYIFFCIMSGWSIVYRRCIHSNFAGGARRHLCMCGRLLASRCGRGPVFRDFWGF